MKRVSLLLAGVFGAAVAVGAVIGNARFERVADRRPVCASCHHGSSDLDELAIDPPHSTEFGADCHGCHVLPVREYLSYSAATVGFDAPDWVAAMDNPTFGGQTCLECHLARGRGVIACEQCHADGTLDVQLDERCEACHDDHVPLDPHGRVECRDCHVEVYLDPHGRADQLMEAKLHPSRHPEAP